MNGDRAKFTSLEFEKRIKLRRDYNNIVRKVRTELRFEMESEDEFFHESGSVMGPDLFKWLLTVLHVNRRFLVVGVLSTLDGLGG